MTTTPDGIDHYPHTEGGPDFRQTCYADGEPWPCSAALGDDGATTPTPPKAARAPRAATSTAAPKRSHKAKPKPAQDAPSAPATAKAD